MAVATPTPSEPRAVVRIGSSTAASPAPSNDGIRPTDVSSNAQHSPPTTIMSPVASTQAREYLATLQRIYTDKRPLATTEQRARFCKVWNHIIQATGIPTFSGAERTTLSKTDVEQMADCDKVLLMFENVRQTEYSDPETDWLKNNVEMEVRSAINTLGLSVGRAPTIGTLPVGFLNARVVRVPGAADPLIILNDDVFWLPFGLCKAAVRAIDFKTVGDNIEAFTATEQLDAYLQARPDITRDYEIEILRYLHLMSESHDEPLTLATDLGLIITGLYAGLAVAIEIFIMAHEYAHVVLGHTFARELPLSLVGGKRASGQRVSEQVYSWKQEFEADAIGFLIMKAALKQDASTRFGDWRSDPSYPFYLTAPNFFFLSMDIVEHSKSLIETGKAAAQPSEHDVDVARRSMEELFAEAQERSPRRNESNYSEPAMSHPPFAFRYKAISVMAEKAQEEFFSQSKLDPGVNQLYRFGKAFQRALISLSMHAEPFFKERYEETAAKATQNLTPKHRGRRKVKSVRPNELAPDLVSEELKGRGIEIWGMSGGPLRDAFVKYDFLAGHGASLLAERPDVLHAAEQLAATLGQTGVRSKVAVRTRIVGARVHFRLIGLERESVSLRLTNNAEDELPVGLYYIWTERGGVRTSSQVDIFRILKRDVTIDIVETSDAQK